ncbi:Arylsulfatase [Anatilimnocola aggregata]|uniref:Arylsulfatase n=1 Tax=Anatilimnocola aggregata TaxID=2528021 RepID=A0A517YNA9_9BACT|nr:arylsulfatase [Anatilimnocola aggregata]QDU31701.1 Arylsulfatase [Anatilimnocola aggregata]
MSNLAKCRSAIGLLLLVPWVQLQAAESAAPPNIVFILLDDMGYGQPPCYRADSEFKTPDLDRLARTGMRFTDAHSAAAVCTPTRYGVLTGRYPSRIGQFGVLTTFSRPIIPRERLTVASFLKQHGYHTACIGKWHLGMNWDGSVDKKGDAAPIGARATDGPTALGFDVFAGYTHARNIGMIVEQDKVVAQVTEVETQPWLTKKALEYIDGRAKAGGPFFLYLPLCPPHTPIVPPPEFDGKSGVDKYGDWLYQGDWITGQVLDALDRHGLTANTLVIATSDNGAAGRVYAPLRASKSSIYEGGHRVPFLVQWPGKVKPGTVCDDTICLNDLMATCAEIIGAKLPDNAAEDSVSILPNLLGTAKAPVREATIHQSPKGDLAIRKGDWKLIFFKNGERELYNLQSDLSETNNIAAANSEVVERLTVLMRRYIADGRSTPGPTRQNDVPIEISKKKAGRKEPKK